MPESTKLPEPVNYESRQALLKIAVSVGIAILVAAAQIVAEALPHLSELILSFLPAWAQGYAGPVLTSALLAAQAWLLKQAKKQHKEAVSDALHTPAPDETSTMKRHY